MNTHQPDDELAGLVRVGMEALREGDRAGAYALFGALARRHPQDTRLWLGLAAASDSAAERRAALEHALAVDPHNRLAQQGLAALDALLPSLVSAPQEALSAAAANRRLRLLQVLVIALAVLLVVLAALFLIWPAAWASRLPIQFG